MTRLPAPVGRWFQRHPEVAVGALQIAKSVVAAVTSWWVVTTFLHSELSFLAPWTALMTVHATIYRTVNRGLQTLAATVLGVLLTAAVAMPLGVTWWSLGIAITIGLVVSRLGLLREEGIAVATTALFIMAGHDQYDVALMIDRILEVGIGVGVGLAVNALVIPPLRRRQADRYIEETHRRMGRLLVGMAEELRDSWSTERSEKWIRRTEEMDDLLQTAWGQVRLSRESARWNPRAQGTREEDLTGPAETMKRLHEGVAHLRHLVRTLDESTTMDGAWDDTFRRRWTDLALECGRRLADPDVEPTEPADALDRLSEQTAQSNLPPLYWPLYGALITSLRHITRIADDVTDTDGERHVG